MINSYGFRKLKNRLFFVLCAVCVVIAVVPLASILFEVAIRGAPQLSITFLTANASKGGIGHAIQGTLIIVGLTSIIGIPIGILSGVYLSEFGNNRYTQSLRTINNMLTQFPSIIVGITAYALIFNILGSSKWAFSTLTGAVALSFIMIPIITRTTEESLKLVPNTLREASLALGAHKWRTTLSVVLPTTKTGLITGILLAVARVAGETAPLIMTIQGSRYFFRGLNGRIAALPLEIWTNSLQPYPEAQAQGWGAALILIIIVLTLNIAVRLASRRE
ncbi:MAG: phosphate ABC transporter permease PstA [Nitrososphaerota archaeon]|jgi:phosphate transport system permease protein|nr:phosphate ABC transporter permease PstA [Nitrososphaerota archaeon]